MYITITPQKLGANFNQSSMWKDVTYEPGEVKAVVYKDGAVIGEKTIKTYQTKPDFSLTLFENTEKSFSFKYD